MRVATGKPANEYCTDRDDGPNRMVLVPGLKQFRQLEELRPVHSFQLQNPKSHHP